MCMKTFTLKIFPTVLAALASALVASGNFHGLYSLSTDLGVDGSTAAAAGGMASSITVFLFGMYLYRHTGGMKALLHGFSGLLMVVAVSHYAYTADVTVGVADGRAGVVDAHIAAKQSERTAKEKELETLAQTVSGGNISTLRSHYNRTIAKTFRGASIWTTTEGCTKAGHPKDCGAIIQAKTALDAEVARVAGSDANAIRTAIAGIDADIAKLEGDKLADNETASRAGFIQAMTGANNRMAIITLIAAVFSVLVEGVCSFAFGLVASQWNPSIATRKQAEASLFGSFKTWVAFKLHQQQRAANVKVVAEAKEAARAKEEIASKAKELSMKEAVLNDNVLTHLTQLSASEVGRLMDAANVEAADSENAKAVLRDAVMAALAHYDHGMRIVQNGNDALFDKVGVSRKYASTRIIPALEAMGLAEREGKGFQWVSKDVAWKAIGVERKHKAQVEMTGLKKPSQSRKTRPHHGVSLVVDNT